MTPDPDTLRLVADDMLARVQAELIMRDDARREGKPDIATMHGDRAQAFNEAAAAILAQASDRYGQRFKCAKCGAVSYNAHDVAERYCGRCHEFAEPR